MVIVPPSAAAARDVKAQLPYLARKDIYQTEKPYGADFPVDHFRGSQLSNHIFEAADVMIRDVRENNSFTLDKNGFCFLDTPTNLPREQASNTANPAVVQYLSEVERLMYEQFPQYSRIEIMDYQVRKRAPGFPEAVGQRVDFEQPAAMPHTDFSVDGAFMRMQEAFPGQEDHYKNKSFDLINVWRVLHGPNDDWPLALCDYESVNLAQDTLSNDCLHQTRIGENWLLLPSSQHRWYYLSGQGENDLIVFRNTDSEGVRARAFHVAFRNPLAGECEPRESIEVRLVAFR